MTSVILNGSSFHEDWGGSALQYLLPPESRVLIIPLSANDEWGSDARLWEEQFRKGRRQYEALVRPFRAYGIKDAQIQWINYYEDDQNSALDKIRDADVLYLVGSNPSWMMQRLEDLGIVETVRSFRGTVMSAGTGSLLQLSGFRIAEDDYYEREGLGLITQFSLLPDYRQTERDLYALIRMLEDEEKPVVVLPARSGVIYDHGHFEALGEAMLLRPSDLDSIYEAMQAQREMY